LKWFRSHVSGFDQTKLVMASQIPGEDSSHPPSESDLSNLRIGEFLLLRRLGSGGMADVYLAEQASLGRYVAVKVLKNDAIIGGSEVLLRRFEQEARAAGGLSHPHLVQIITTGREGEISYIVQEYVAGLNLSQWMKKHGAPDFGTGLKWMQQVASALRAASEAGIVHRDVKPENIMVNRAGVAKVTDFGLAQLNQPSSPKMNLTQAGTTMGTPWYMSPEQIQGDKLDHRSDQYSLGVTCYHMFAGQPPFPGKNAVTVAVQHLKEEPVPLNSLRGDLPRALCDVIHRMLEKKPGDRFQTGADLKEALERLNTVPVNARLGAPAGFAGRILSWLPDARRAAFVAAAVFAVTFVAGRRLDKPVSLPAAPGPERIAKEESAIRQFAVAMLQPNRAAAWRAVSEYFPESSEADLASLRLGVALMSGAVPDAEQAFNEFANFRNKAAFEPETEKSVFELLGMIGQAYALRDRERDDQLDRLISDIQNNVRDLDEEYVRAILDRAPSELRQFFYRIQFRDQRFPLAPFRN